MNTGTLILNMTLLLVVLLFQNCDYKTETMSSEMSKNAKLNTIETNATLIPVFDPDITSYTVSDVHYLYDIIDSNCPDIVCPIYSEYMTVEVMQIGASIKINGMNPCNINGNTITQKCINISLIKPFVITVTSLDGSETINYYFNLP